MGDLRATLKQSPIVLLLRGDVTLRVLDDALVPIDAELRRGPRGVLLDVRNVTRLHGPARERLSSWSRAQRSRISALAVVTTSTPWRVVIKAMSLMGTGKLRAFDEPIRATAWLTEG